MSLSGENLRFVAAGHLSAAQALIAADNASGATTVLRVVREWLDMPGVDNPPQFRETIDKAIADPKAEEKNIERLTELFCDWRNTAFEKAGIRMGKG